MCQLPVSLDSCDRALRVPLQFILSLTSSAIRRRKTKCSGERPVCFHCRRSRQRCVYEPYSSTVSDTSVPPPPPAAAQDNVGRPYLYIYSNSRTDIL